jgi:hypothetical protein
MSDDDLKTEETPAKATKRTPAKKVEQLPSDPMMTLLTTAIDKDLDISKIERLVELKKSMDADEAKKQYLMAMSVFQSLLEPIEMNGHVQYMSNAGPVDYKYSEMADIKKAIQEPLKTAGLSYCFRPFMEGGIITVTTIISHSAGHQEEFELRSGIESNSIKGIKSIQSTISYLKRYGLTLGLGLVGSEQDIEDMNLDDQQVQEMTGDQGQTIDAGVSSPFPDDLFQERKEGWANSIASGGKEALEQINSFIEKDGYYMTQSQYDEIKPSKKPEEK